MARVETKPWDLVDYLTSEEDIVAHLEAALEDGNPQLITVVLGDIARAKGMTAVAREAGLGRESLYKALSSDGNPNSPRYSKWCARWGCNCMRLPLRRLRCPPASASKPLLPTRPGRRASPSGRR